jgi:hypothetical protein
MCVSAWMYVILVVAHCSHAAIKLSTICRDLHKGLLLFADRNGMDLFRALLQRNEMSARALALTHEIIQMNPAHYTAWWTHI